MGKTMMMVVMLAVGTWLGCKVVPTVDNVQSSHNQNIDSKIARNLR